MKKAFAILTGILTVAGLVAFGATKDVKGLILAAVFAVLTAALWPRREKTRPTAGTPQASPQGRPQGPSSAQAHVQREGDIIQESIQIMGGTMHVDTFVSRYMTARKAALRLEQYTPDPEAAADILATVDESFRDFLPDVVERELQSADRLKTPKGRIERAEKALEALQTIAVYGEGSDLARMKAVKRIEDYMAVQ